MECCCEFRRLSSPECPLLPDIRAQFLSIPRFGVPCRKEVLEGHVPDGSSRHAFQNRPTGFWRYARRQCRARILHCIHPPRPSFLICRRTEGESDRLKLVTKRNHCARCSPVPSMDEGRQRVLGIMAAILARLRMQTADDLFGGPQGSPRSDKLIAASF